MNLKKLVVIDMQNDFLTGSIANWDAERVKRAVQEKINSEDWDEIIFTRDTHDKNYLNTYEGEHLPVEHCLLYTDGWCIDQDLMTSAYNSNARLSFFDKVTFCSKDLIKHLGSSCCDKITFVGVCTGICVISNVLGAKENIDLLEHNEIFVDANCCSCVTKESHDAAILTMKMCQVNIINE